MIDAAGVNSDGDTGSGDYTTFAWVEGVGKGFTITPAKGDTSKRLFLPNMGGRDTSGISYNYGNRGYAWPDQSNNSNSYLLFFGNGYTSGRIGPNSKLYAYSLRCVRS